MLALCRICGATELPKGAAGRRNLTSRAAAAAKPTSPWQFLPSFRSVTPFLAALALFLTALASRAASPQISVQPQNRTVVAGNAHTFTVNVTGSAPLAYQWQREGTGLPNQ